MLGLEGRHLQTPFGGVTLVAPVIEGANATATPVVEGVIAKVEVKNTSDAVIIIAPAPKVVDVEMAQFLVNSKRLQLLQLLWILSRPLVGPLT